MKISPLGDFFHQGFILLVDEKDTFLSLTPVYLLCGLSFPLWMPSSNLMLLTLLSGVLTVGIGDTAASFIGTKWGVHKWFNSEKTVEGTVACVLSQVCVILGLTCCGRFWFLYASNCCYLLWLIFVYFTRFCGQSLVIAEKHFGGCINIVDRSTHRPSGQSGSAIVNVCVFDDMNAYTVLPNSVVTW